MRDIALERKQIDEAIAGQTLCSVFAETCARLGDLEAMAIKDPDGKRRAISWTTYRERVRDVALGLHSLGVTGFGRGSFGVIMARNRPEHVIADLGIVHAGATPVSLYNTLAPEQISYIANHCEARIAFVENAAFLARFAAIKHALPKLDRVIVMSGEVPAEADDA